MATESREKTPLLDDVKEYNISATVTIDINGYARVIIHDRLGHNVGDRIPLWSVTAGKVIGEMTVELGTIKNGHTII